MSNSIHSESNNNSENSSIVSEQDKYNPEQNSMREPSSDLGRKPLTFIIYFYSTVNFNHLNENTNAETNLNNNSFLRLNSSRNDFLQYPYISNFNFNINSNNQNSSDNNNNNINEGDNYSNTESLFDEVDEEYPNQEAYEPINYGNTAEEVFANLGLIINNEK